MQKTTEELLRDVRRCTLCANSLPLSPNPVLQGSSTSRVLLIGQAPGVKAHETTMPWNDPSGDRLRVWLGIDKDKFYDPASIALVPMGFCYPGRGKSGDLPPEKACAPTWHTDLLASMPIAVRFLIGQYAQNYYLPDKVSLTQRVKQWRDYLPDTFVLPHPSPRNNIWLKRNPWFEAEVVPAMQRRIEALFD